jgi:CHRD domain
MKVTAALALSTLALAGAQTAWADDGSRRIEADLVGYNEPPSVSTTGNGRFKARINEQGTAIDYELTYEALEGNVQQAHIHIGQKAVNGGIVIFLCTNLGNGPGAGLQGNQPCPTPPAKVEGRITAADVTPNAGAVTQGIAANQFDEVLRAIRAGATYVNVHSDRWPGGEIRDQLRKDKGHGHH